MPKTLVIGANGFIGSHLVDSLKAAGHTITAFDRFSSGTPLFESDGVQIVRGEFLSRADLDSAVTGQDYVFHFLSTTTPATAEGDPTLDIRTNVAQTVELLESCVAAGVAHLYFASTGGAIYGDQGKSEYSETDRALPVSPYGIGKLAIEHYLHYFRAKAGLSSTALRISNPYGTRQRPNRKQGLIPIALRQIALGQPVVRLGDGSMVRDYIYVQDAVDAITRLVGLTTEYDLYNIGSGTGYSINEVLAVLEEVTGSEIVIDSREAPATYVDRVVLDTARYQSEFGPLERTALAEGARRTYEEVRAQLGTE